METVQFNNGMKLTALKLLTSSSSPEILSVWMLKRHQQDEPKTAESGE